MMSFMKDFDYLKIQMEDIVSATNNFHPTKMIGSGGFGRVYKGELPSPMGKTLSAFKQLDRSLGQGNIEFWKEIMMLSKYKHENLISLMHFCIEGDEMILVYEYASRGSLDRYLSDAHTLTWIQRLKICVGAARGLQFLHDPNETQQRVLHRDIKSANILLDEKWTAKVSDFGLSKVGPANQAHTYLVSHGVGTPGYCDPLYMELGFLSKESDVYSFGVVLFEVLCGRLCYEYHNCKLTKILVPKWRQCYDEKRLDEIILPGLKVQMDPGSLKSFSAVAFQCVKKIREERPTMAEIVKELELSLKHQEIFENTPESNHRERTSLMLNGRMDLSLDDDNSRKYKWRFHGLAHDDYSEPPHSEENETDDSKDGSGTRTPVKRVLESTVSGFLVKGYRNGDVYQGEFYKGKCSGSGVYCYKLNGRYEGDWVDQKYDGYGVETWAKGSRYRGQYREGLRHGFGVYRYYVGDMYAGEWVKGQCHGFGVHSCEDGSKFFGEFKGGVKHGLGHYHFRNGDMYAGEYFADKMHGFGVYNFANGHRYEGGWHEGKRQGFGLYTFKNGDTRSGYWEDGALSINPQSVSHAKVLKAVEEARQIAKKAIAATNVDEKVNRAVAEANRAANAARVAADKAV